jgi:hypothetical protein
MSQPRRTAPSSAPTGLPPGPAYVPQAALASERMLGSVLSRLAGRPSPVRTAPAERRAERVPPAARTLPQSTTPRSDEAEAAGRSDEKPAAQPARRVEPSELLPVTASWTPPGARGGLAAESSVEEGRPLWSTLPKLDLAPVVAAVEAQLSERQAAAAEHRQRPELTVISGSPTSSAEAGAGSGRSAQRAAEEASARLLEALRAHAAARATASDDRITLGDMTLIAHADSKQQLAAATRDVGHAPAELPLAPMVEATNPKVKPDQHTIAQRINRIAELIRQDLKMAKKIAAERFGVP